MPCAARVTSDVVKEELYGFDLDRRYGAINRDIASACAEMTSRLRALGLPDGDISVVDRETQDWTDRLVLVEVCRRFLISIGEADQTDSVIRRIETYEAEYQRGVKLLADLPSDYFSVLPVVKTIVGTGVGSGAGSGATVPSAGGLSEDDIKLLISDEVRRQVIEKAELKLLRAFLTFDRSDLAGLATAWPTLLAAPDAGKYHLMIRSILRTTGGLNDWSPSIGADSSQLDVWITETAESSGYIDRIRTLASDTFPYLRRRPLHVPPVIDPDDSFYNEEGYGLAVDEIYVTLHRSVVEGDVKIVPTWLESDARDPADVWSAVVAAMPAGIRIDIEMFYQEYAP